ncbi:MAG: carboxypeptidase-like regulatory domain-containing protein, partial [Bryobacteraceae bacterium]|nr:carboxypeptidase-like regulatory domain-containing protein [Bryobacteraceae bacterium]
MRWLLMAAVLMAQSDGLGTIAGTVRNSATGGGVKRATVYLNSSGGRVGQTTAVTDSSGSFRITGLPAGAYRISAQHPDYPPSPRMAAGMTDLMLEGGEQKREVVIQLSPAAAVEGKVTGEEGEPLSGCSVSLMRYLHL